jgi:hypothetical protein
VKVDGSYFNNDSASIVIENYGTLTVIDSTFTSNSAPCVQTYGAATVTGSAFNSNSGDCLEIVSTATVSDSTFTDNSAGIGGGIDNFGTLTVSGSTFTDISAYEGGGLFNGRTATVIGSTFSGNSVELGGGGIDNNGTLTLTNCTISGNTSEDGAGIANDDGGNLTLNNTIVAGNSAPTNSDVDGAYTGSNNLIGGNPLLAALGNYGGPTYISCLSRRFHDFTVIASRETTLSVSPRRGIDEGLARLQQLGDLLRASVGSTNVASLRVWCSVRNAVRGKEGMRLPALHSGGQVPALDSDPRFSPLPASGWVAHSVAGLL